MHDTYTMNDIDKLIDRATDSRNAPLSRQELSSLWAAANTAMHQKGAFPNAFRAVEALLCQADRGNVCPDALTGARALPCVDGCTAGMVEGFFDRVESFNRSVNRR